MTLERQTWSRNGDSKRNENLQNVKKSAKEMMGLMLVDEETQEIVGTVRRTYTNIRISIYHNHLRFI